MSDLAKKEEADLGDATELVAEIIGQRVDGYRSSEHGSDDDDLLGAVEALEDACKAWRLARASAQGGI